MGYQIGTKGKQNGFIELVLLSFLAVLLIQVNSLWALSKLKLNQEKISADVLKEDSKRKLDLLNLLATDPKLSSAPIISEGVKTLIKSPDLKTSFSFAEKGPSLNWLFFNSLQIKNLICNQVSPSTVCSLSNYTLSNIVTPYTDTRIKNLSINPNEIHSALISLGHLNIENLILDINSPPKFGYILISGYSHIKIDKISGAMLNKTKLLIYSVVGDVEINDVGTTIPCDNSGEGDLVIVAPSVHIAGINREDLKFSNKTCLKDFPNQIFTSIKIATIH